MQLVEFIKELETFAISVTTPGLAGRPAKLTLGSKRERISDESEVLIRCVSVHTKYSSQEI